MPHALPESLQEATALAGQADLEDEGNLVSLGPIKIQVSFRRILLGYTAIVIGLVAGLLIVISTWNSRSHLRESRRAGHQHLVAMLARSIEPMLQDDRLTEVRHLTNRMMEIDQGLRSIRVVDEQGQTLAERQRGDTEFTLETQTAGQPMANWLTAESPMFDEASAPVGRVIAVASWDAQQVQWRMGTLVLVLAACVGGVFCLGLTLWLSRKLTAPVERLIQGTHELSRCNFSMRVAPTRQRELSLLVKSFNSLAEALAESTVSQNYVNSVFDSMSEGLVIVDKAGVIESVNPAFCLMSDRAQQKLIGEPVTKFMLTNEGATLQLEVGSPRICEQLDRELLLTQHGGSSVPVSVSCTERRDGAEDHTGYVLVFKDIRQYREAQEELERLANVDPLTGALNRRAFMACWDAEVEGQPQRKLAVVMVDIDYFKRINDTHGHMAGDEVLTRLGEMLSQAVGEEGKVCRYGGEEFCVLLPDYTEAAAREWAERFRLRIQESRHPAAGRRIQLTCTLGVAASIGSSIDPVDLINQADNVLNSTKREGRNRVGVASAEPSVPQTREPILEIAPFIEHVPTIEKETSVTVVAQELTEEPSGWLIVVDEHGEYCGCVGPNELGLCERLEGGTPIKELVDTSIPAFQPDADADMIAAFMARCNTPLVVILSTVDGDGPKLPVGIVLQERFGHSPSDLAHPKVPSDDDQADYEEISIPPASAPPLELEVQPRVDVNVS